MMHQYGYQVGDPILLLNCNAGTTPPGGKSLAQQVANATGAPYVIGNNDYVYGTGPFYSGHYVGGTVTGLDDDSTRILVPGVPLVFVPEPPPLPAWKFSK